MPGNSKQCDCHDRSIAVRFLYLMHGSCDDNGRKTRHTPGRNSFGWCVFRCRSKCRHFLSRHRGFPWHTLIYTYTNAFGCSDTGTLVIQVLSPIALTCGNALTDVRDNQVYPTVQIGTQCWMAASLNYGATIASSAMQRDNCLPEKYCYKNITANCSSSGGLYQWDEVMQYGTTQGAQGLCPPGWHVPKETDWNVLFTFYTSSGFAGSPLKESGFSGFDALLSGIMFENSTWKFDNFATFFWSSDLHSPTKAWAHSMNFYNPSVSYYPSLRTNAFPVRCMKD